SRHTRVNSSVVRIPTVCSDGRCGFKVSRNRRFSATTVPAIVRSQNSLTTRENTRHPFPPAVPPPVGRAYRCSQPRRQRITSWQELPVDTLRQRLRIHH